MAQNASVLSEQPAGHLLTAAPKLHNEQLMFSVVCQEDAGEVSLADLMQHILRQQMNQIPFSIDLTPNAASPLLLRLARFAVTGAGVATQWAKAVHGGHQMPGTARWHGMKIGLSGCTRDNATQHRGKVQSCNKSPSWRCPASPSTWLPRHAVSAVPKVLLLPQPWRCWAARCHACLRPKSCDWLSLPSRHGVS